MLACVVNSSGTGRIQNQATQRGILPAETISSFQRVLPNAPRDWSGYSQYLELRANIFRETGTGCQYSNTPQQGHSELQGMPMLWCASLCSQFLWNRPNTKPGNTTRNSTGRDNFLIPKGSTEPSIPASCKPNLFKRGNQFL